MPSLITDDLAKQAATYLSSQDLLLAPVIAKAGICPIRPHQDYYRSLVESIIGQQLSVKAAASIRDRFLALFNGTFPLPEQILKTSLDDMRAVGFSRAKGAYVQDLAQRIIDGKVDFASFDNLSSEEITAELTAVKGIGEWTTHMFMMFCMARTNILPYGDLGIRSGIQKLYGLPALPNKAEVESIAEQNHWSPYESIASWYIWQSLDNAPIKSN